MRAIKSKVKKKFAKDPSLADHFGDDAPGYLPEQESAEAGAFPAAGTAGSLVDLLEASADLGPSAAPLSPQRGSPRGSTRCPRPTSRRRARRTRGTMQ